MLDTQVTLASIAAYIWLDGSAALNTMAIAADQCSPVRPPPIIARVCQRPACAASAASASRSALWRQCRRSTSSRQKLKAQPASSSGGARPAA